MITPSEYLIKCKITSWSGFKLMLMFYKIKTPCINGQFLIINLEVLIKIFEPKYWKIGLKYTNKQIFSKKILMYSFIYYKFKVNLYKCHRKLFVIYL